MIGNNSHRKFQKMFGSKRSKQHHKFECEICSKPNETIKQLTVRTNILAQKACSLLKHDYKNTNLTASLRMTLTSYFQKSNQERASHPSSFCKAD